MPVFPHLPRIITVWVTYMSTVGETFCDLRHNTKAFTFCAAFTIFISVLKIMFLSSLRGKYESRWYFIIYILKPIASAFNVKKMLSLNLALSHEWTANLFWLKSSVKIMTFSLIDLLICEQWRFTCDERSYFHRFCIPLWYVRLKWNRKHVISAFCAEESNEASNSPFLYKGNLS